MRNGLLAVLLLALLLTTVFSPFAGLAVLLLFLFASTLVWTVWTLVRTALGGSST